MIDKLIWLIYFPIALILMIFCWLTNWFVVLFANSVGQLPKIFKLWQTWDDTLDSQFFMTEVVPDKYPFLDYHWTDKYIAYNDVGTLLAYNKVIAKVLLKPDVTWTFKEKLQRYCCRVLWLMRNPAYGFSFYILGAEGYIENVEIKKNRSPGGNDELLFAVDNDHNILFKPWTCRFYQHLFGNIYLTGYLGWKIPVWQNLGKYKAMLAYRIVFKFHEHS